MKALLLVSLAAAAVVPAALSAQPVGAPLQPQFAAQGVQTRAQVVEHVRTMFARLDANRDGSLTRDEVQAARGQRGQMRGQRGAANGARAFERFDLNRDGAISRAEWDARSAHREQRRGAIAQAGRNGGAPGLRGGGMGGRMFAMADVNRDNRVTFAEAQSAALQRFDRADLNRDGALTPEERQQRRQLNRGERQRG